MRRRRRVAQLDGYGVEECEFTEYASRMPVAEARKYLVARMAIELGAAALQQVRAFIENSAKWTKCPGSPMGIWLATHRALGGALVPPLEAQLRELARFAEAAEAEARR